ncbi:3-phosphoshikimate 1-carboxyvinyltransferase [Caldanaerobacter subterraneus subsp. yonseiensis KB-1]|uniref:3-phosphoshikimate 1-carboxyvinyltransferase n=1 Tax=Caldanaerobacter subterraneus subsp. yonseiensis KB-1 TaxID=1388761 RepID=U5CQ41_CALSX|nr:3-phosphoshikimate 1-carboxyvinyltransferase [Caldanaerobacter subterraneus]ERM92118.1 3-phosphoshikimate 1-carboxyvinyltransferase [Caldanaerobacter subterraneus subsp. yonseiensis KB-1]
MDVEVKKKNSLKGVISVPGDKSISHRAVMIGSIAEGLTEVENFLVAKDTLSTVECMRKLGVDIKLEGNRVKVYGKGLYLSKSSEVLDVGNSGTTIRLLMGILAGQEFETILTGDDSIKRRPMGRVIVPLTLMGAKIEAREGNFAPVKIRGGKLRGIEYKMPIASAQVKSSIMLASLYAEGMTVIEELALSRNHTELMLQNFGARIEIDGKKIFCYPESKLKGQKIIVPGDISSAAYFIVAANLLPNSDVVIKDVNVNPTRTGIIDVLKGMGGNVELINERYVNNEKIADIVVKSSKLKGIEIGGDLIPKLIDEIPVIAVAAVFAEGTTVIKNAEELKVKESNRIKSMTSELGKMGAKIFETEDGMIIEGTGFLRGAEVESYNDHRVAMSLWIAGLLAEGRTIIKKAECVDVSYPDFYKTFDML